MAAVSGGGGGNSGPVTIVELVIASPLWWFGFGALAILAVGFWLLETIWLLINVVITILWSLASNALFLFFFALYFTLTLLMNLYASPAL